MHERGRGRFSPVGELIAAADPKRVGVVLACAVAGLAFLGLLSAGGVGIDSFDLLSRGENPVHAPHPGDRWVTVPAFFSGGLLLAAAALALAVGRRTGERGARSLPWVGIAVLFATLAIEQAGAVHERVGAATDASTARLALVVGLVGAAPFAGAALLLRRRSGSALTALAGALWLVGHLLLAAEANGSPWLRACGELLAIAGAALATVGLVSALRDVVGAPQARRGDRVGTAAIAALVRSVEVTRLAVATGACIVGIAIVGALIATDALDFPAFDVGAEQAVPTLFSAALLAVAAGLALLQGAADTAGWRWWAALSALFAFMAFAEVATVHERISTWAGGESGQIYLAPIIIAGAVAWIVTLRRIWRHELARLLYIAGAATWSMATVTDVIFENLGVEWWIVPEDTLELAGSALFLFALLVAFQAGVPATRRDAATVPAASPPAQ